MATTTYVAKLDPKGDEVWHKHISGEYNQDAYEVVVDGADNIILSGLFVGEVTFGGESFKWVGSEGDAYLAKWDASGKHVFSKHFGTKDMDWSGGVAVDKANNVFVGVASAGPLDLGGGARSSAGGHDSYVAKYSADGSFQWGVVFGDAADDFLRDVVIDGAGNVVLVGSFAGGIDFGGGMLISNGETDAFVAKLAPDATHLWSQRFGDSTYQAFIHAASGPASEVFLAGEFQGTLQIGSTSHPSAGGDDIVLARLAP